MIFVTGVSFHFTHSNILSFFSSNHDAFVFYFNLIFYFGTLLQDPLYFIGNKKSHIYNVLIDFSNISSIVANRLVLPKFSDSLESGF